MGTAITAHAQKKIDLDDLSVKGDLQNDSRLKMSAREASTMIDRVKYRTNYRPEILESNDFPEMYQAPKK